ncbi:MAG: zinc-dependent metalloprotease [Planctomycetia bacterium]|nr:zinc-dependent metalloprotease [Planctomycetia bacterium]
MSRSFLAVAFFLAGLFFLERDLSAQEKITVVVPAKTVSTTSSSQGKLPEFKTIAPEATPVPGLLNFYRHKNKLYMEAASGDLNTDFIIIISIAKGIGRAPLLAGWSWDFGDDMLWQFRKVDDRIQIVRRNFRHQANSGTPEAKAVSIAFTDSILFSLPILAKGPKGGDIIDLTSIFMSDLPQISSQALPGFYFAGDRSTWAKVKGLKDNMELEVAATYSGGGYYGNSISNNVMDTRGISINVHYSISKLPNSGYQPRYADERVGYFNTVLKNYSKNPDDGNFVRYISRWNLKKMESGADTSLAKKPIIFWLEKTVPYQYRKPIRDGILEWNKAFEKAGFYNAIEVRQQEDNDTWDPEDINYNTIRWSTANVGFSIGPNRVNPLNGEVLDADVILDVGFITSWNRTFELYSPKDLAKQLAGPFEVRPRTKEMKLDPKFNFEELNQEDRERFRPQVNESLFYSQQMGLAMTFFDVMTADELYTPDSSDAPSKDQIVGAKDAKKEKKAKDQKSAKSGKPAKDAQSKNDSAKADPAKSDSKETKAAKNVKDDPKKSKSDEKKPEKTDAEKAAEKAKLEAARKTKETEMKKKQDEERKKLINQGLQYLATHEVGHTLGLRHNFKLSTLLTLEELNDPAKTAEFGYAGSVMEYMPVNIMPKGMKQGDYYPTKLGKYDYWAIEYGYKDFSKSTDSELDDLKKIASLQTKPEYNFATDEDCYNLTSDPLVNTFDLGKSPLEYSKLRVRLVKDVLKGLNDRIVKDGESYRKLSTRYNMLLFAHANALYFATKYIGGMHINRDFKGDANGRAPFEMVSAKEQRAAFDLLKKEVFGVNSYKIPSNIYNYLAPNRWYHWGSSISMRYDMSIHDDILLWQNLFMEELLDPIRLSHLNDAQFRASNEKDLFTAAEMVHGLTQSIFAELNGLKSGNYTLAKQAISSTRRNLQRMYVEKLNENVLGPSDYIYLYGLYYGMYTGYSGTRMNDFTSIARMELIDLKEKINGVLDGDAKLDSYSKAHLLQMGDEIEQTLKAIRTRR